MCYVLNNEDIKINEVFEFLQSSYISLKNRTMVKKQTQLNIEILFSSDSMANSCTITSVPMED